MQKRKSNFKQKLKSMDACSSDIELVGDRTEAQAWRDCHRGDWMLWYYARKYPHHKRKIVLAKAHCANTVRHLMQDKRSTDAVDTALKFAIGKASRVQLDDAAHAAAHAVFAAADPAYVSANGAFAAAHAAYDAAYDVTHAAAADAAGDAAIHAADAAADAAAMKKNQKKTADICRKYLRI